jgi:GNAT superfamily N-acetyltransferase
MHVFHIDLFTVSWPISHMNSTSEIIGDSNMEPVVYQNVTEELKKAYSETSESNADSFIVLDDDHHSIIALAEGRPIGLVVAKQHLLPEPLSDIREVYIDVIEVHTDFQRRGIGTELMRHVTDWALGIEAQQIRAWSEEIRVEALQLWKKLGFSFSVNSFQPGEDDRYGFYISRRID